MTNKKNKYLLLIFSLIFGFMCNANANELDITKSSHTVDFNKKGNIKITLTEKEDNIAINGAELSLFHIADAKEKDHNLIFEYTKNFTKCSVALDDITVDNLAENFENCLKDNTATKIEITNKNGKVSYNNLDLGLYLVKQTNKVKGYSNIDSFIVIIPKVENNKWTYSVEAEPKIDIYKTMDVKVIKVWNKQNENTKLPESVKIQLLKGINVIDTVILNKENNWNYVWEDIEKSDKYSVKEIEIPEGYTVSYTNNENTFTVTNTDELPRTGQIYQPIILLSAIGVLFILVGLYEIKKETHEE